MKKIICILVLAACVLSLTACGDKSSSFYDRCDFDNLETFTAITEVDLHSSEEDEETATYKYVLFENSESLINSYKEYLTEYGFVLSSDIDSAEMTFTLDEKVLLFEVANGASGTQVNITLPFDEETLNAKKEEAYQTYLTAFNEGRYADCLGIAENSSLQGYKDFDNMNYYAAAKDYMDKGNWLNAKHRFKSCSGFKDADEQVAEIEEQLYALNGIYEFKNDYSQTIYVIISYGEAQIQVDSALFSYKPGDPIDHYSMRVHKGYITEDGVPFINNEYGDQAVTNEDGTRVWTPVLVNNSADGSADEIKFVFSPVEGGGMMLTPSGGKYKHMLGVYHKVADVE